VQGSKINQAFCTACFSGKYPTGLKTKDIIRLEKERLKNKIDYTD